VIPDPDALVNNSAVVVEVVDAGIAEFTVRRERWSCNSARAAEAMLVDLCILYC